jgi:hypothetical protein
VRRFMGGPSVRCRKTPPSTRQPVDRAALCDDRPGLWDDRRGGRDERPGAFQFFFAALPS